MGGVVATGGVVVLRGRTGARGVGPRLRDIEEGGVASWWGEGVLRVGKGGVGRLTPVGPTVWSKVEQGISGRFALGHC